MNRLGFLTHVQGDDAYRNAQEITQFNPGIPDFDAAVKALELIATEIAPALGWKPQ